MGRARLTDIDRAKGLAIVLVVIGHVISDELPSGNEWCIPVHTTIYKFHMAFFMFVTGFLTFYTYPEMRTFAAYRTYVKKKFFRLIPAYFLLAVVFYVGKAVLGEGGHMGNPAAGFGDLMGVFVRPYASYARSLWYVYVVFIYFLIVPPLLAVSRGRLEVLLCVALAAYFLPRTYYLGQNQAVEYLFVFLLGGYALRHRDAYLKVLDTYAWISIVMLAGITLLCFVIDIPKLVVGSASIPALHSLVRLRVSERIHVLPVLGRYVFPIYLLNSILIGAILVFLQRCCSLSGASFVMLAPIVCVIGLLAPIVVYELLIKRTPVLSVIIRA